MATDLKSISVQVSFEETPEKEIQLIGFLFLCNGRFLQAQPIRQNLLEFNLADNTHPPTDTKPPVKSATAASTAATSATSAAAAASAASTKASTSPASANISAYRILIAPATDPSIQQVRTLEQLDAYKPYEPVLTLNADNNLSILPIPALITRFWPFCTCRVTGKVSKWFSVNNAWEERSVCRARVHICDIDAIRYWIYKIPDYIIAKIPQAILNPAQIIKNPIPIPDPPPFTINNIATFQPAEKRSIFQTTSVQEQQVALAATLPDLSLDIRQTLASGNINRIREIIVANYTTFHPWFCLWPWWWPWFYHRRELAVVYTDASGRFDKQISYFCTGDKPDIYIWIEYQINGVWTTVYEPPIPCNTWWDYACGTPINIHITDPRVPGNCCCDCPIPGEVVWIRSVGGRVSVSHIQQKNTIHTPPVNQSQSYNRIGLTDASALYDPSWLPVSDGDFIRPFGGSPTFIVGFGNDLPNAGIYYYRWRYRKVAAADLSPVSDTYKALPPAVGITSKTYEFTYIDSHGDTQFSTNSVKLGPFTVGANDDLYIIPTENPDQAPFSVPEANPQWTEPSYRNYSINFNSADLRDAANHTGDGLYEFIFELFDQAGNLLTALPKSTFKTPEYNTPGTSENAPDILLANPTSSTADGFNMLLRIDNAQCQAGINTVNVNGVPASSDCCGFVAYKPNGVEATLDISFLAMHPNNFAYFDFTVERGTCGFVPIADATGMVIDNAGGYTRNGASVYDKSFTPAQLLEGCYANGTGKGAFAENLYVAAMATDGDLRQTGKDASGVAAFALEP